MSASPRPKGVKLLAVFAGPHTETQRQLLLANIDVCKDVNRMGVFIKKHLRTFRPSGIIITVDVDPEDV